MTDIQPYEPFTNYVKEWVSTSRKNLPEPSSWDEMIDLLNVYHLPPYSLQNPLYLLYKTLEGETFTVEQLQQYTSNYLTELTTRTEKPLRIKQLNIRTSDIEPSRFTTESLADAILNHVIIEYDESRISPVMIALATGSLEDVFIEMFEWINYNYTSSEFVYLFQQMLLHENQLWRLTDYEVEYLNLFPEWQNRFYNIMTHTSYTPRKTTHEESDISSFGVFISSPTEIIDPYEYYWRHFSKYPDLFEIYNTVGDIGEWLERTSVRVPITKSIYEYIQSLTGESEILNKIIVAQKSIRKPLPQKANDTVFEYTDRELQLKYIPVFENWTSLTDYRKRIIKDTI